MRLLFHISIVLFLFCAPTLNAQESQQDIEKIAEAHFKKSEFIEATPYFSRLLTFEPRNINFNYKYGTCLLYNSNEKKDAFKYLNYAIQNASDGQLEDEAYYYLGKAFHLTYQFDKAISNYNRYKQKAGSRAVAQLQVDRQIEMCQNGKALMEDLNEVIVLKKSKVPINNFFRTYDLKDIGGQLIVTEEFQSPKDKRMNHIPLIHFPVNANIIYYSSYGRGENKDIYYRERLLNGSWGEPTPVWGEVNTDYNEDFPYMSPDGKYLYFSSEGHNSMGGYDIYRSAFDPINNTFGAPENMDIPISSPDNDLFYIADSLNRFAYFASQRASEGNRIEVYNVRVQRLPSQMVTLKGQFASTINPSEKILSISVATEEGKSIGTFKTTANGEYLIILPRGGMYSFVMNVAQKEQKHKQSIEIPTKAQRQYLKQSIVEEEKEGRELLVINNRFNENFDDMQSVIAEAIELKSKMEVNDNQFDLQALEKSIEHQEMLAEIGLANYSNSEIQGLINSKETELSQRQKNSETLIKTSNTVLAENSKELAETINKADSLNQLKANSEHFEQKKYYAILEQREIDKAKELQEKVMNLSEVTDYLEQDYKEKEQLLKESKTIKEKVKNINFNDDKELYDVLSQHQEFGKDVLKNDTKLFATNDIQEEINKKIEDQKKLEAQKSKLDKQIATVQKAIDDLQTQYESASKRGKEKLSPEISREEILKETLEGELKIINDELEELGNAEGNRAALMIISNTKSATETVDTKPIRQKNQQLGNQLKVLEENNLTFAEDYQIDFNEEPVEFVVDEVASATNESETEEEEPAIDATPTETALEEELADSTPTEQLEHKVVYPSTIKTKEEKISFLEEEQGNLLDKIMSDPALANDQEIQTQLAEIEKEITQHTKDNISEKIAELNQAIISHQTVEDGTIKLSLVNNQLTQLEINQLIDEAENEVNPIQKRKLLQDIKKKQQSLIIELDKTENEQKANQAIAEVFQDKTKTYENIVLKDITTTEKSLKEQQNSITEHLANIPYKISEIENNNAIPTNRKEALKEQYNTLKNHLEAQLKDNQDKQSSFLLQHNEVAKTPISDAGKELSLTEIERTENAEKQAYNELYNKYQELKEAQRRFNTKSKQIAAGQDKLNQFSYLFEAKSKISEVDKENIEKQIWQIDNLERDNSAIAQEIKQLQEELEGDLNAFDSETRLKMENLLAWNIKPIESMADTSEEEAIFDEVEQEVDLFPQTAEELVDLIDVQYLTDISQIEEAMQRGTATKTDVVKRKRQFLIEIGDLETEILKEKANNPEKEGLDQKLDLIAEVSQQLQNEINQLELEIEQEQAIVDSQEEIAEVIEETPEVIEEQVAETVNEETQTEEVEEIAEVTTPEETAVEPREEIAEVIEETPEISEEEEEVAETVNEETQTEEVEEIAEVAIPEETAVEPQEEIAEVIEETPEVIEEEVAETVNEETQTEEIEEIAEVTTPEERAVEPQEEIAEVVEETPEVIEEEVAETVNEETQTEEIEEIAEITTPEETAVEPQEEIAEVIEETPEVIEEEVAETVNEETQTEEVEEIAEVTTPEETAVETQEEIAEVIEETPEVIEEEVAETVNEETQTEEVEEIAEVATPEETAVETQEEIAEVVEETPEVIEEEVAEIVNEETQTEEVEEIAEITTPEDIPERDEVRIESYDLFESVEQDALIALYQEHEQLQTELKENPSLSDNRKHQKKIAKTQRDVVTKEQALVDESFDNIRKGVEDNNIEDASVSLLSVQQTNFENKNLINQLAETTDPEVREELTRKIQENNQKLVDKLAQERSNNLLKLEVFDIIENINLEHVNFEDVVATEASLNQEQEEISRLLLKLNDQINTLNSLLPSASKKEKIVLETQKDKLLDLQHELIAKQELNESVIANREKQKQEDVNLGIAQNAIQNELTYADEVEIAQTENYQELFQSSNALRQKQFELRVKQEKLEAEQNQLLQLNRLYDEDNTINSEELILIENHLKNIDRLLGEIDILRYAVKSHQNKIKELIPSDFAQRQSIENMLARDVAPIKEIPTLPIISSGLITNTSGLGTYSESNPIQEIEEGINGLIFRVQIGAFSRPVPETTFADFHPIAKETVRPGLVRYVAGLFGSVESATEARNTIRTMGYDDAFVVAYCEGERIPIYRARELISSGACLPSIQETVSPIVSSDEIVETPMRTESVLDEFSYNKGPDAAEAEASEAKMGLYFTVQVGVYNRPVSSSQIFNISPLVTKRLPNGQIRYSTGIFNSVEEAQPKRSEAIEKGVTDAYITAYYQGKRISIAQAREILQEQGESILEKVSPTVLRGNRPINNSEPIDLAEEKKPFLDNKKTEVMLISRYTYSDYPTQVLNRYNSQGELFYFDSISKKIKSFLYDKASSDLSSFAKDFETVEYFNNIYPVINKDAILKNQALLDADTEYLSLRVTIENKDINTALITALTNAPANKIMTSNDLELKVEFYLINSINNEKIINNIASLMDKLGATHVYKQKKKD